MKPRGKTEKKRTKDKPVGGDTNVDFSTPASSTLSFASPSASTFTSLEATPFTTLSTETQLPNFLATNFVADTANKHAAIAYDPTTKIATNIKTNDVKEYKKSDPIKFIPSSESMTGTNAPAAARKHRHMENIDNDDIIINTQNKEHVICMAHGDMVQIEALQADHADSADAILARQEILVEKLNENREFAEQVMAQPDSEKFFALINGKYQGTQYFYERYYNDINNIWLICQACNLHKTNKDPKDWFLQNKMFGEAFLKYIDDLGGLKGEGLILKVGDNHKGLAETAISWFQEKQADFLKNKKLLYRDVIFDIENIILQAAHEVSKGCTEKSKVHFAQAQFKIAIHNISKNIKFGIHIEGATPPSSQSSTSDEDNEKLSVTVEDHQTFIDSLKGNSKLAQRPIKKFTRDLLREISKKNKNSSSEDNTTDTSFTLLSSSFFQDTSGMRSTQTTESRLMISIAEIREPTPDASPQELFEYHSTMAQYHKEHFEFYQNLAGQYKSENQQESTQPASSEDQNRSLQSETSKKRKFTSPTTPPEDRTKQNSNPNVSTYDAISILPHHKG